MQIRLTLDWPGPGRACYCEVRWPKPCDRTTSHQVEIKKGGGSVHGQTRTLGTDQTSLGRAVRQREDQGSRSRRPFCCCTGENAPESYPSQVVSTLDAHVVHPAVFTLQILLNTRDVIASSFFFSIQDQRPYLETSSRLIHSIQY
jgi:hypothetical protein